MQTFHLPPTEPEPCCPKCGARRFTIVERSISIHTAKINITAKCGDCAAAFTYMRNLPHHDAPPVASED